MPFNTCEIASVIETSIVEVGWDYAGEHVLLSIPREGGKGTSFLFTPEEARTIIGEMEQQLRIIRGNETSKAMSKTWKEAVECGFEVGAVPRESLDRPEEVTAMSHAEARALGERLIYVVSIAEDDKTDYYAARKN